MEEKCGSGQRDRVPALQVWSLEFIPQSHPKQTKTQQIVHEHVQLNHSWGPKDGNNSNVYEIMMDK
jgi:hypothetical protein